MKVVAFNGSPRADSNTAILIRHVFAELNKEGIETEEVSLAGKPLRGCLGCYKCYINQNRQCIQSKDALNGYVEKMIQADGIIMASPVYVCSVPSEMKALIDRAVMVNKANGGLFRRKVGAAVVAARRGGMITAFDTLNHFFLLSEMIVPGVFLLEFCHRTGERGRGQRPGRHPDHAGPGPEHGVADEEAVRVSGVHG